MEIPVYIGGSQSGTMDIVRQGAYTLFTAHIPAHGGLRRFAVFGGGRSGYLGVAQPEGGAMVLRRRLSRAQLRDFPASFEYAAEIGAETPPRRAEDRADRPKTSTVPPDAPSGGGEEERWTPRPDGSLICCSGGGLLLALPCELRRAVRGADLRRINGGSYMVFRY